MESETDRAVSNVVGVAILIGLVVILSVVVGAFVFDLTDSQMDVAEDELNGTSSRSTPQESNDGDTTRQPNARTDTSTSNGVSGDMVTFVCGSRGGGSRFAIRNAPSDAKNLSSVHHGTYSTTINLHNPTPQEAVVNTTIVFQNVTAPGKTEHEVAIQPGESKRIACSDVSKWSGNDAAYQQGYIALESDTPLSGDVFYTTKSRAGNSIEIVPLF